MAHLRLTEKGLLVSERLWALEAALATIWREPFETYDLVQYEDWFERREAALHAWAVALRDELG